MLTYTQDTQRKEAAIYGRKCNNWLDCDVVQEAITQLESFNLGSEPQEVRDSISYLGVGISYRANASQRDMAKGAYGLLTKFEDTMTLAEHVKNKNESAIKRFEEKANAGETVRIM